MDFLSTHSLVFEIFFLLESLQHIMQLLLDVFVGILIIIEQIIFGNKGIKTLFLLWAQRYLLRYHLKS
jgi:hypothetical protein